MGRRFMLGEREIYIRVVFLEVCAEIYCSVLVKTDIVFEKCYITVDFKFFYKVGGICRFIGRL